MLGVAAFHILLALAESEGNGVTIAQRVERASSGAIRLMPGALYRYLKNMTQFGWIAEFEADDDDGRRKYYRLTGPGRRVAQEEALRLDQVTNLSRSLKLLPVKK